MLLLPRPHLCCPAVHLIFSFLSSSLDLAFSSVLGSCSVYFSLCKPPCTPRLFPGVLCFLFLFFSFIFLYPDCCASPLALQCRVSPILSLCVCVRVRQIVLLACKDLEGAEGKIEVMAEKCVAVLDPIPTPSLTHSLPFSCSSVLCAILFVVHNLLSPQCDRLQGE